MSSVARRTRPSLYRLPRQMLMACVHAYRLLLQAWIGNRCRFEPSCSAYALQALQQHGAGSGSLLTAARLLRCHPWCDGGFDPVPDRPTRLADGLFSRLGLTASDDLPETRNLP